MGEIYLTSCFDLSQEKKVDLKVLNPTFFRRKKYVQPKMFVVKINTLPIQCVCVCI